MAVGMLGRYEEALALYKQVVKPQQAHYNLAVVCEARQDTKRATAEFAIARSIGAPLAGPAVPAAEEGDDQNTEGNGESSNPGWRRPAAAERAPAERVCGLRPLRSAQASHPISGGG